MLVGDCNVEHVKFVSYTGKYPNLCSGVLTLEIDGEEVKFGGVRYDMNTNKYVRHGEYGSFWHSGGSLDSDYCPIRREWNIDVNDLPEKYRKYATEIDLVFNTNVPHGCCGGCS